MKALFVGLGSIGQRHLRNLHQIDSSIETIAYRSVGRNLVVHDDMTATPCQMIQSVRLTNRGCRDLAEYYGIKSFTDYSEALEQKPNIVFITCPTSLHIPMALEAAKHNCHLFIEKPLSHNLEGVDELISIVKERKLIAMVGYQMRFHSMLSSLHDLIQREPAEILSVCSDFGELLPFAHPYEDYRTGYAARKDLGGGVLLCLSHEIDYLQWLFGMPTKVFAIERRRTLDIDVEDSVDIMLECSVPVHVHLDFLQDPPLRKLEIIKSDSNPIFNLRQGRDELYLAEMQHFLKCVKGSETPMVDIEEGLKSLKIILAAKRSMESGNTEVHEHS